MNNLKKVYKHLNKEDLSIQRIELSDLNKLKSGIKKVEGDLKAGQKYEDKYKRLTGKADDLAREFSSLASDGKMGIPLSVNLFSIIKEITSKGKELGVDMSKNSDVKFARTVMAAWEDWKNDVQKLSDKAESFAKKLR
jgi:hypothetical protein